MYFESVYIIGFGSIGQRYYNIITKNKFSKEVYVFNRKGKLNNSNYNVFEKISDVTLQPEDLVIICNPASLHTTTLKEIKNSRAPVLVEKPLSNKIITLVELEDITSGHPFVHLGYNLRYLPVIIQFRKLLFARANRRIHRLDISVKSYLPKWRPNIDYRGSVSASKNLGGGVLLELSHELDLLIFLFCKPKVTFARYGKYSDLKIDVEDNATILFELYNQSNTLGKLEMSMSSVRNERQITVQYEKETLHLDLLEEKISIYNPDEQDYHISIPSGKRDFTYIQQLKDISVRVSSGMPPACSIQDGNEVLHIIDQCKKLQEHNKRVKL